MSIDEPLIQEIVQRILTVTNPDKIIFFGSAATGEMTRDSEWNAENARRLAWSKRLLWGPTRQDPRALGLSVYSFRGSEAGPERASTFGLAHSSIYTRICAVARLPLYATSAIGPLDSFDRHFSDVGMQGDACKAAVQGLN